MGARHIATFAVDCICWTCKRWMSNISFHVELCWRPPNESPASTLFVLFSSVLVPSNSWEDSLADLFTASCQLYPSSAWCWVGNLQSVFRAFPADSCLLRPKTAPWARWQWTKAAERWDYTKTVNWKIWVIILHFRETLCIHPPGRCVTSLWFICIRRQKCEMLPLASLGFHFLRVFFPGLSITASFIQ